MNRAWLKYGNYWYWKWILSENITYIHRIFYLDKKIYINDEIKCKMKTNDLDVINGKNILFRQMEVMI